MQILQVTIYSDLKFGGPTQKIHALSHGLVQRGHAVEVATFRPEQPTVDPYSATPEIKVRYLKWVGKSLVQAPLDLAPLADAVRRADVVHCYGLYDLLVPAAAFLARKIGRPYVLEPLGMYVPRARHQRSKQVYHRLITSWLARDAARVVATSSIEADELRGLVAGERLVTRRNGIDVDSFASMPAGNHFRACYNIEADERVVLYVGRISPIKNLEQLVQAFKLAALPRARLMLVGPALEPEYEAKLRGVIADVGLADRVVLTGPLYGDEKLAALAAADLFVLPSLYESYGNAAAEAVAAGIPVLLTDGCGIASHIHERAGLSVPATAEALAGGMQRLLDHPEQRDALTRRRTEILPELTWKEPLEQTEQLYAELMAKNPTPRPN
jgi:glycosyltransferase involved in cell wall biosynthesis